LADRFEAAADRELVAAMAAGETAALRGLNARYGGMLNALAWRILRDEEDAEEIVADTLWQAWREAANFDPSRGSVSVWLITFARSRAIDRIRARNARRPPADDPPDEETSPDPIENLSGAERARMVRRAMDGLEAGERNALELAYFSDLSQSEIAAKLAIPLGTVKTRIRAGMLKLRKALALRRVS
jgi:RNA polymerase sigma-70 factor (ECF subfamily)